MTDCRDGASPEPSEDISPYSEEELAAIAAYRPPPHPDRNCDWCGKPYKGLRSGSRICLRCWANRVQIAQFDALEDDGLGGTDE